MSKFEVFSSSLETQPTNMWGAIHGIRANGVKVGNPGKLRVGFTENTPTILPVYSEQSVFCVLIGIIYNQGGVLRAQIIHAVPQKFKKIPNKLSNVFEMQQNILNWPVEQVVVAGGTWTDGVDDPSKSPTHIGFIRKALIDVCNQAGIPLSMYRAKKFENETVTNMYIDTPNQNIYITETPYHDSYG